MNQLALLTLGWKQVRQLAGPVFSGWDLHADSSLLLFPLCFKK